MLIGIGARLTPDLVIFSTGLKIGLLLAGGAGTYLLIRSFRVLPPAAFLGGLLVG